MNAHLNIAFFGSSLVSSYWNGAATYYRGIIRALAGSGHRVTFYEPDAFDRQKHRDIEDPDWARVVVYDAEFADDVRELVNGVKGIDVVVKASGVGVHDELLEEAILELKDSETKVVFWDVDAPATLERLHQNQEDPFRESMARYGFSPATRVFEAAGGGACIITDAWEGIEMFLMPDTEILVAEDHESVVRILDELTHKRAMEIGNAARVRILSEHTYEHRVLQLEKLLSASEPLTTCI